jgi:hypothetical protein
VCGSRIRNSIHHCAIIQADTPLKPQRSVEAVSDRLIPLQYQKFAAVTLWTQDQSSRLAFANGVVLNPQEEHREPEISQRYDRRMFTLFHECPCENDLSRMV